MQRRDEYHRRYEAFKSRGHPFWPYTIVEDTVVALGVLLILLFLAIFVGTPLESAADPTNTAYIPRPEWYFMFLFELLKLFPAHLEWVGAALVPALGILALLLLPFYDRNPRRVLKQRPVAMGLLTLTLIFVAAETYMAYVATPGGIVPIGLPVSLSVGSTPITIGIPKLWVGGNREDQPVMSYVQLRGQQLYEAQSCSSCHMLGGGGGQVGPPLDEVAKRRTESQVHNYIEEPTRLNPQSAMPAYLGPLTHQQIDYIAQYLSTRSAPQKVAAPPSGELKASDPVLPQGDPRLAASGKSIVNEQGCLACHRIQGNGAAVAADLTEIGNRRSADWLLRLFKEPQEAQPGTFMPKYQLSGEQLNALVAYLTTLKGDMAKPGSAPGERASAGATAGPGSGSASSSSPGNVAAGKTLFQQNCGACHEFSRVAPPLSGSGLLKSYPSDDSLVQKIRAGGTTGMPGYGTTRLSDAQMTDLVAYLRSLR